MSTRQGSVIMLSQDHSFVKKIMIDAQMQKLSMILSARRRARPEEKQVH